MSPIAKLLVAGLFSLNQYVEYSPDENAPKRLYTNASHLSDARMQSLMFSAAHHSCRYIAQVFSTTATGSSSADDAAAKAALKVIAGEMSIQTALAGFEDTPYYGRALKAGLDLKETEELFIKLCSPQFNNASFTDQEAQEMVRFIRKKIHVLNDHDLNSLGHFRFFGSFDVFDRNSKRLGTLNTQGRRWVTWKEIPDTLKLSLIGTEDTDFWAHQGIKPSGLTRIALYIANRRSSIAGGSTLTMQLLKNMFFWHIPEEPDSPFVNSDLSKALRKAREIYWAKPFELHLGGGNPTVGKESVMTLYLNLVELGPGIQGAAQAAQAYFEKEIKDLTFGEAIFITSLLKSPSKYSNPDNFERYTTPRVKSIIERMSRERLFPNPTADYNEALHNHLPSKKWQRPLSDSLGKAFIYVRNSVRKWLDNWANASGNHSPKEVKVVTTIDSKLQDVVFRATRKVLDRHDSARARNNLRRVQVAVDASGAIAQVQASDLSSHRLRQIQKYLDTLNKGLGVFRIYIVMGSTDDKELIFQNTYPSPNEGPKSSQDRLVDQLNKATAQGAHIGQLVLLKLTSGQDCQLSNKEADARALADSNIVKESFSQKRARMLIFKDRYLPKVGQARCIEALDPTVSNDPRISEGLPALTNEIRASIVNNALTRLGNERPRSYFLPALYDDSSNHDLPLILENGTRPQISNRGRYGHWKHLRRLMKRTRNRGGVFLGDIVWLKGSCGGALKCPPPSPPPLPHLRPISEADFKPILKPKQITVQEILARRADTATGDTDKVTQQHSDNQPPGLEGNKVAVQATPNSDISYDSEVGDVWDGRLSPPANPQPETETTPPPFHVRESQNSARVAQAQREADAENSRRLSQYRQQVARRRQAIADARKARAVYEEKRQRHWADVLQHKEDPVLRNFFFREFDLAAPPLQAAVVVMDSHTGEILANFGGYDPMHSEFDRSQLAQRQPGSTLKPWIYFRALQKGFTLNTPVLNSGITYNVKSKGKQEQWSPNGGSIGGSIRFESALVHSQNQATAGLIQNPIWGNQGRWSQNLRDDLCPFLENMKLYRPNNSTPTQSLAMKCFPSSLLGGEELFIQDLVRSYSFFSNGTQIIKPQLIRRVVDSDNRTLYEMPQGGQGDVVPNVTEENLFSIRHMLINVNIGGTGKSLNNFLKDQVKDPDGTLLLREKCFDQYGIGQACFGGKTGTTNDAKDAWYVGFSSRYVIGVWVGYDRPEPIPGSSEGATLALPIFKEIIKLGYKEDALPAIEPLLTSNNIPGVIRPIDANVVGGKACLSRNGLESKRVFKMFLTAGDELSLCPICRCTFGDLITRTIGGSEYYDYDSILQVSFNGLQEESDWSDNRRFKHRRRSDTSTYDYGDREDELCQAALEKSVSENFCERVGD